MDNELIEYRGYVFQGEITFDVNTYFWHMEVSGVGNIKARHKSELVTAFKEKVDKILSEPIEELPPF